MIYKNLYIIGNGFDIHHGIKCGFLYFKEWLKKNNNILFHKLTQVYDDSWNNNWWQNFENSLAQLNIITYASNKGNLFDPEFNNDDSLEERTVVASSKVREEFSAIKNSLKESFQNWLYEVYGMSNKEKKLQLIEKESIFLSFNYTKTLEDIYGIDTNQICHIHGFVEDKDSMIFGHGLGLIELNDILERQKPRALGKILNKKCNLKTKLQIVPPAHIELATQSTKEEILTMRKDVDSCIEKNKRFFDDILDVKRIFVYGFSFSSIDMPYLEKIIRRTNPETHWVISWYSQDDKRCIMDFVIRYDIHNITMIHGIQNIDI